MSIYLRSVLFLWTCIAICGLVGYDLSAQSAITSATFSNVTSGLNTSSYTAVAPSDASGGVTANTTYTINYGTNRNQFITDYTIGSTVYNTFVLPDTLIIQRTDAGRQLIIFYEHLNIDTGPDPDAINIRPEEQDTEELLYESGLSNAGYDNILVNSATNFANVERIDVIYYSGVVTSSPGNAVFPIVERGGNDDIRVAAIRGLDANGEPNDYYPTVVRIRDNDGDWGNLGQAHVSIVMRRQDATSDPLPQTILSSQNIHGTAVSFTEFGVSANEIVYGYSIFADDVTATGSDLVDFSNDSNFPTTTSETSGLDLIAGISTAVASDNNLTRAKGPGGYKQALNTWLKANVGVTTATDGSTATDWQDQWLGDHDATTLTSAPTYRDGTATGADDINFNPTIDFLDATERGLQIANNSDFNTATSYSTKGINLAFRTGNNITTKQQIYEQGSNDRGINVYVRNGSLYVGAWNIPNTDGTGDNWGFSSTSTSSITTDTEYIVTLEFNGNSGATGTVTAYLNGQSFGTISNVGLLFADTDGIGLGDTNSESRYDDGTTAAASFYGSLAEFIYCDSPGSFSSAQRNRIESYLALKYGITLDQTSPINYVNSKGTIIFNTTNNASIGGYLEYNNDIAGIGRDDESEFEQLQSQSENDGSLVRITKNTSIGGDDTWLIWGNDGGALTETATGTPDTIDFRLTRVWRVAEESSMGVTDIAFDINDLGLGTNANNFSLLIGGSSSGGDFSSGTVVTGGTVSTIDGRSFITFNDINLSDGQYFTLGTDFFVCSPGGVESGLELWYRADEGTNTTADGVAISSWADQYVNNNDAGSANQGGTPQEPTYAESAMNFNPAIRFTDPGTTDNAYLESTSNPVSGNMSLITVFSTTQSEGSTEFWSSPALIGAEASGTGNDFALGLSGGRMHAKIAAGDGLGTRSPASPTYSDGIPHIATVTRVQAASGALELYIDSENVASGTSDNTALTDPEAIGIGNHDDPITSAQFAGDIAEVIVFSSVLSTSERNRIETYLAVKYGITRDQTSATDYVAADGGTVWEATTNSAHNNDIAGIGRDDLSCLNQKQSISANSDAILTMGLGTIAATNDANANSFSSDDSFLIWGNDDGATAFANRTTGISDIGTVTERMTRIWRVDENTDVGNTSISFDLSGLGYGTTLSNYQLIVSDNSDLSSATLYQAASINSNVVTFTGINLTDGQYLTLGTARSSCGPGGVTSDLYVWLRADAGTSTTTDNTSLTTWSDQSSTVTDATSDGTPPLFKNNTTDNINFNPTVDFDGTDDRLTVGNLSEIKSGATNGGDYTMIGVGLRQAGTVWNFVLGSTGGTGNQDLHFGYRDNNTQATLAHWGNDLNVTTNNHDNPLAPYILYGEYDGSGRVLEETRGGNFARATDSNSTDLSGSQTNYIGDVQSLSNYNGLISEVIVFDNDITDLSKQQIYTYLAIKYGITLTNNNDNDGSTGEVISGSVTEGDYVASDGSTILWDFSANTSYHNDVAGIGRDDDSCFQQKQSTAEDTDDIITIGLGSVASTNAANMNTFTDNLDFFIWGNDDGATAQVSANTSDLPSTVAERMTRVWKVEDNGSVGATEIQFDLTGLGYGSNADDFRLIVSNTSTMADGTLTSGGTFNGSVLSFSGVDLSDGQFFTLGTALTTCGPGGVNTNIALWLRADEEVYSDAGSTLATDENDALQWNDQSSPASNASETNAGGGAPVEPVFRTNEINYNPANFISDQNTTNDSYFETAAASNTVDGDMTLIAVFETAQNQGTNNEIDNTPALIGAEANSGTNDYGLGLYQGELVFNAANTNTFTARSGTTYRNSEPYIATGTRVLAASGAVNLYVNSLQVGTGTSDATALSAPGTWAIGNQSDYDNEAQFQGNIAEVLVFSSVLTGEEQARVESYLALKYGITRTNDNDGDSTPNEVISGSIDEGDYVAGDGGIIWDYAARGATYFNDIAGIGRDDLSCFSQTHSKSENNDAIVDIEIVSFTADDSWLLWGNDNAAMEAPDNKERPAGINSRLNREWQVQETGTVGTVSITFDLSDITGTSLGENNLTQVRLMVDTDDDFSSGVTLVSPTSTNAIANTVTFSYNFNGTEGYYYTLGSIEENALPVTLVEFGAENIADQRVSLRWKTASEENSSHFVIERSADGHSFESIGAIDAAGNSDNLSSYVFTDHTPLSGTSFYRLKQVDLNGEFKYSEVIGIFVNHRSGQFIFSVFPNPINAGDILVIEFEGSFKARAISYQLVGMSGNPVSSGVYESIPDRLHVNTSRLKPGVYLLKIVDDSGLVFTSKILLQ